MFLPASCCMQHVVERALTSMGTLTAPIVPYIACSDSDDTPHRVPLNLPPDPCLRFPCACACAPVSCPNPAASYLTNPALSPRHWEGPSALCWPLTPPQIDQIPTLMPVGGPQALQKLP